MKQVPNRHVDDAPQQRGHEHSMAHLVHSAIEPVVLTTERGMWAMKVLE